MADPGIIGLGQVSLFVRDAARAESFYRDVVGLDHLYTFGQLVFFALGDTRLYLHAVGDAEWVPGSLLYLMVDDLEAERDRLIADGVDFLDEPHRIHTHPDGREEWMSHFEDPDGNRLVLMAIRGAAGA